MRGYMAIADRRCGDFVAAGKVNVSFCLEKGLGVIDTSWH